MAEAFTFPVEAGKVREFAIAVLDDDNPIYWDVDHARAHGFKAPMAPPTFVQASSFWRPTDRSAAQRDMRRVLHGEQAYDYLHPIYVGDVLTVQTQPAERYEKTGRRGGSMTFVVNETTYTNHHGQVCVRVRSTSIETEKEVKD